MTQHKVFISYHHENDERKKMHLEQFGRNHRLFINQSVDPNDHLDRWRNDQDIRERIRDEHLSDSTVTIVLIGHETWNRKHVDWEIYSSMYDGRINSKSGIIAIELPDTHFDSVDEGRDSNELLHFELSRPRHTPNVTISVGCFVGIHSSSTE